MSKIQHLFEVFESAGKELYLVGGYVRDKLLGVENHDFDFATNALPNETSSILESAGYKVIPIGLEFGTIVTFHRNQINGEEIQITTYRCKESYKKGSRHPKVVFGGSLQEDLIRRDFTVNTMAMDRNEKIIDPFGGEDDINNEIIRTPIDPHITFEEDPLRMLRAFRFTCKLGFSIEEGTFRAICDLHTRINNISHERWKMEMDKILAFPDGKAVAKTLEMMKVSGILTELIPEFEAVHSLNGKSQGKAHNTDVWNHTLNVIRNLKTDNVCVRWAALLHDIGKPVTRLVEPDGNIHFYKHEQIGAEIAGKIANRFKFSNKEKATVKFLVQFHMRPVLYTSEWSDRAVRKLIREAGEHMDNLLLLASADIASLSGEFANKGEVGLAELRERIIHLSPGTEKRQVPSELGKALFEILGTDPEGARKIGIVLQNLEELVLDGKLPPMADVSVYLDYLEQHPELRIRKHKLE